MTAVIRPRLRTLLTFFIFNFALVIAAHAAVLSGRVVDPDGRPVANAEVIVSGSTASPLRARTNADGRFELPSLADGRYSVIAAAPGLVSDPTAIDVSGADATLDLTLKISAIAETLVVSAAQIDQPLSRTPDSVTVIPGAEIDAKQQFTLGSALRSVPGLTLQQNGGPGTVTSLFTRGGESDFTLVLVDGVRANSFGGGLDLSQVPLQDVDRIEVIRGPQSALYGSDAIGGVINVITRSGGAPAAQAQLETGSREMRRAAAATTGEVNGVRWQVGANYFEDPGFTGTAANGQTVSNDDAQETQASASIGWRHASAGSDVQGSFQYVDTERGSPGPYGSDPAHRYAGVDTIPAAGNPLDLSAVPDTTTEMRIFPRGYINLSGEMMGSTGPQVTDPAFPRRSVLIDYVMGLGTHQAQGAHPTGPSALTPQEQQLFNFWVLLGAQYK